MLSSLSISSASTYAHVQPRDEGQLSHEKPQPLKTHIHTHTHTSNKNDLFEVAVFPLLPVHHVMENWDHNVADLGLRHQGDTQEGTHHSRDEVRLVVT